MRQNVQSEQSQGICQCASEAWQPRAAASKVPPSALRLPPSAFENSSCIRQTRQLDKVHDDQTDSTTMSFHTRLLPDALSNAPNPTAAPPSILTLFTSKLQLVPQCQQSCAMTVRCDVQ